jgi:hypothetical protein
MKGTAQRHDDNMPADDNLGEDTKRFIDRHIEPAEKRPPAPSVRRETEFASKDRCVRRKKPSAGGSLPGKLRDHSRCEQSRVALAFRCKFEDPFRGKGGRLFTLCEMQRAADFFERSPHGRDRVGLKDEETLASHRVTQPTRAVLRKQQGRSRLHPSCAFKIAVMAMALVAFRQHLAGKEAAIAAEVTVPK